MEKLKASMKGLEQKINESKRSYSASLRRLEALNTEIHERRGFQSDKLALDPRKVNSTGSSPEMRRVLSREQTELEEVTSVDSIQIGVDYSGSTGSLPSIGRISHSPSCDSDLERSSLEPDRDVSAMHKSHSSPNRPLITSKEEEGREVPAVSHPLCVSMPHSDPSLASHTSCNSEADKLDQMANELVIRCLARAVSKVSQEGRSSETLPA